ncbi:MAG: Fic family protein [Atopobiaceae bacterium]
MEGSYQWYEPTKLSELDLTLSPDVVNDVACAEGTLAGLSGSSSANTEGIARLLLRADAVASSKIEGLQIGARRLARAELHEFDPTNMRSDWRAKVVLGNIHAMERGVRIAGRSASLSVESLCDIHRELCRGTDIESYGGVIRTEQNWIGTSGMNPLGATYIPPAPEMVPSLLEDLMAFANRTDVPPVVQAALCHSQFESIHPFMDGNGRVGRALIQVILLHRGAVRECVPPISLALATRAKEYRACLFDLQHWTEQAEGRMAVDNWVSMFSAAVVEACHDMGAIAKDMSDIRSGWIEQLGREPRRGSALEALLVEIQNASVFSVESLVASTGRSTSSVNSAVNKLLEAGIIALTTRGKRNRVFEAPEVLEEFGIIERRLASPARDTRVAPPVRPVPDRKSSSRRGAL